MSKTFEEALAEWEATAREAKRLAALEVSMRNMLVALAFPDPQEGTNTFELADGRKVKAVVKINRTVDQAAVIAVIGKLRGLNDMKVTVDDVFKPKIELGVSAFKKLEGQALSIASEAVTSKLGTPSLSVE